MRTIESILRKEMNQLEEMINEAGSRLRKAPKGHLRIMKKRGKAEYYFRGDDGNERYLKRGEEGIATEIVQRDYDVKVMNMGKERIKAISRFLKKYKETDLNTAYDKQNQYRKDLIYAHMITDQEYIKQWQAVEYKGKGFLDDESEIITERGERVRSKSEKIIADKLYALKIPYRYEYPLVLGGNIKMYPDFTILKMPEREEVYLEHFGMMDDRDYMNNAINKFSTYEKNGIFLGINLFITYETNRKPISTRMLDVMIRKVFCEA